MSDKYIPFLSGFDEADLPTPDDIDHLKTIVGHPLPNSLRAVGTEYAFIRRAFDAAAPSVLRKHLGDELNRLLVDRRMRLRKWLEKNLRIVCDS